MDTRRANATILGVDYGSGDKSTVAVAHQSLRGLEMDMLVWDEIAAMPPPEMLVISSPLVDGLLVVNKGALASKMFDAKIKDTAQTDHFADALRYGLPYGVAASPLPPTVKGNFPAPPPIPEGLTPEQHAAHLMLHDLLSVEEFETEREKPGFVAINAHWGANGKRRFCCERPIAHEPPARGPAWGQMASWLDKK